MLKILQARFQHIVERQVHKPQACIPPESVLLITTLIAVLGKKDVY